MKPTAAATKTGGKRWNIYFLEFALIFLAVTLGFFAESIREKLGDKEKEMEFIQSMIEDARTDSIHIQQCISDNQIRVRALDTLGKLLANYGAQKVPDGEIYRLFLFGLYHPDFITPTERTMSQLKFSGGMRLLRKKRAVDAIVQYDNMGKNLIDQQAFYEFYQNGAIEHSFKLLNYKEFGFTSQETKTRSWQMARLLLHDSQNMVEFGNRVTTYMGVVNFYIVRLQEMQKQSGSLIKTLEKEYQIQ